MIPTGQPPRAYPYPGDVSAQLLDQFGSGYEDVECVNQGTEYLYGDVSSHFILVLGAC